MLTVAFIFMDPMWPGPTGNLNWWSSGAMGLPTSISMSMKKPGTPGTISPQLGFGQQLGQRLGLLGLNAD